MDPITAREAINLQPQINVELGACQWSRRNVFHCARFPTLRHWLCCDIVRGIIVASGSYEVAMIVCRDNVMLSLE